MSQGIFHKESGNGNESLIVPCLNDVG